MNLSELLKIGIIASIDGDGGLQLDAPKGALTPELIECIRSHKPDLVAEIQSACEVGEHGELHFLCTDPGGGELPACNEGRMGNVGVPDVQASTVQARCKTCLHRKQPGRSDPGYCSGRDDLPPAYGENHPLRKLPDDDGASCKWHQGLSKPDFRTVTHGNPHANAHGNAHGNAHTSNGEAAYDPPFLRA